MATRSYFSSIKFVDSPQSLREIEEYIRQTILPIRNARHAWRQEFKSVFENDRIYFSVHIEDKGSKLEDKKQRREYIFQPFAMRVDD